MEVLTDQNWVLSVGTFLPLVGVLVMLFIPRGEEQLHKQIALVTSLATFGVGIYTLTQFDYDQAEQAAVLRRRRSGSRRSARTTRSALDGISLPLYVLSMFITAGGDHLHVRRHAGGRQPQGRSSS